MGDPGGNHFRPWTLPGRPQGAQGANFKPSWASPLFDPDSGPLAKKAQFRRCPNLENCTGASTAVHFSLFHEFHARARKSSILGALLEAFWVPFGLLGASWSSQGLPWGSPGASLESQGLPEGSKTPPGGSKTPRGLPWLPLPSPMLRPPGSWLYEDIGFSQLLWASGLKF